MKYCSQPQLRLTLNQNYDENTTKDLSKKVSVKTPEYFPRRDQAESQSRRGGVKLTRSAKMIHCVTENGITKCFTKTTRTR